MKLLRGLGGLTLGLFLAVSGNVFGEELSLSKEQNALKAEVVFKSDDQASTQAPDAETITLAKALANFVFDLFNKKNAVEYVREQLSLLFAYFAHNLPGIIGESVDHNALEVGAPVQEYPKNI